MTTLVRNESGLSRRGFLGALAGAGGLVLGVGLTARPALAALAGAAPLPDAAFEPNLWIAIDGEGLVSLVAHRSEMGTGIRTSLPMVLADELGADWDRVTIVQADDDARLGSQNTDGSRSIRRFYSVMREAGATARLMLERSAAEQWGVDAGECSAADHRVTHGPTGRSLAFGALVAAAAGQPVPTGDELTLKHPDAWRYVGKGEVPIADMTGITTGAATFGMDATLPGMKIAVIARCPVVGGTVAELDDTAARAVPGVEQVIPIPPFRGPPGFQPLGGVAVIASNTWAAIQGRDALQITWDEGTNASYDSEAFRAELESTARTRSRVVREEGDVDEALEQGVRTLSSDYYLPHLSHAPMEPPCALARADGEGCEIWAPTQDPQTAAGTVAGALQLPADKVTVHVTLLGGGFGRKSKPDFIVEAALLSRVLGSPVKVVWTREDDIRHDYYHSVAACHMEASVDDEGHCTGWLQRSVFPPISSTFAPPNAPPARQGGSGELGMGFTDLPFDVPNLRVENGEAGAKVRIGWLRSVAHVYHAYATCCFADEVAELMGREPLEGLLELLGEPRALDLSGVDYGNHGEPMERYPFDVGRLRRVTELAAEHGGWGRSLPAGHGLGIACHRSFLSYVANVVEVAVSKDGKITIPRVDVVVDCGLAVNPERVASQMEGAAVFGASLALTGEITVKDGAVVQGNFDDYPVARMDDAPRVVNVHLADSGDLPGGVGETGVPPFAPALANAIHAATGKRIRSLPLSRHDLSWS